MKNQKEEQIMNIEQEHRDFEMALHKHCDCADLTAYEINLAWDFWQARAALQSQDREDADMFWDYDEPEDFPCQDTEYDAVCYLVENNWTLDEFPVHFTLQRAKKLPPVAIKVTGVSDCGTEIFYEREVIDHARRIEGEAK